MKKPRLLLDRPLAPRLPAEVGRRARRAVAARSLRRGAQAQPAGRERRTSACSAPGQMPARAKRVICLHMLGAISHVDTFDYKPTLERMHGQDLPPSVRETQRLSTMSGGQSAFPIVGPLRPFKQRGESGAWVSDFLPYTGAIADELCFVKSLHTEHVNHDPASKFLHTGFQLAGRPSAGAWVSYALGSDNRDLPNFVVMNSGVSQGVPQDAAIWGPGFLPSHHQGVEFRAADDPVLYVNNPAGIDSQRPPRDARLAGEARDAAARGVERSRDPVAREPVRDGVSHAELRARGRGHLRRARSPCSRCTAPTCRSPARSRAIA